jgi:hypothetical protein
MIAQGLRVLRFTNDRILNDIENVLKEIAKYLSSLSERRTDEEEMAGRARRRPSPQPSPKGKGANNKNRTHPRWLKNLSIS